MDVSIEQVNNIQNDDSVYLLDKAIWEHYNMVKTRENVISFMRKYKEARARYISAITFSERGLVSHIDVVKNSTSYRSNSGFTYNSDKKIDAEILLNSIIPLITKVKESFTREEREYYDYCLASNKSENNFCDMMNITKIGLLPIKNSCLLKIAFATNNEVLKKYN